MNASASTTTMCGLRSGGGEGTSLPPNFFARIVSALASFSERTAGRGTLSRQRTNVVKKPPAATLVGRSQSQNGTSHTSNRRMINDLPRSGAKTIAIGTTESNARENQYRPNSHGSQVSAATFTANAAGKTQIK